MNKALVELIRIYTEKAKLSIFSKNIDYYNKAAAAVLNLAKQ